MEVITLGDVKLSFVARRNTLYTVQICPTDDAWTVGHTNQQILTAEQAMQAVCKRCANKPDCEGSEGGPQGVLSAEGATANCQATPKAESEFVANARCGIEQIS